MNPESDGRITRVNRASPPRPAARSVRYAVIAVILSAVAFIAAGAFGAIALGGFTALPWAQAVAWAALGAVMLARGLVVLVRTRRDA